MIDCPGDAGMRERYVPIGWLRSRLRKASRIASRLQTGASFFFPSSRSEPCTTSSFAAAPSSMAPASRPSPAMSRSRASRIAEVGGKQGPARREIDADGLLVTPGWVDVHTHYDGQAMWDPLLAPSSWHGVTTVLFGNCGVGFAPVQAASSRRADGPDGRRRGNPRHRAGRRTDLGLGDLSGILDALERRPRAIDIAAQVAHHPLRVYVMGDRAVRREAGDGRRHRRDAPADDRGAARRRLRLHHLAHQLAQDAGRRAWCRRATPKSKSCSASARRSARQRRRLRHEQRFRRRGRTSLPG